MLSVLPDLEGSKLYIPLYLNFHQVKFTSLQVFIVVPVPNGTFSLRLLNQSIAFRFANNNHNCYIASVFPDTARSFIG